MTGATKSGMLAVDPNSYRPLLDSVKAMAAKYEQHVSTFKGYVDKPGGTYWEGQTATAAQNNAGDGWKTIARIQDLDEKYQQTAGPIVDYTILRNLTNGQNLIHNAEGQPGVKVNEDLSMTYTPPEGMSKEQADKNAKIVADAAKELKGYGGKWWDGDQQVKHLTEGVIKDIENEVNSAAGTFDVGQAVKDTAPRKPDNAQGANFYKQWYPKDASPASTQAAAATATDPNAPVLGPPSPGDKPPVDPSKLGGLTGNLGVMGITEPKSPLDKPPPPPDARTAPAPKLDPNTPQGKAAIDAMRTYLQRTVPPDQVEAKLADAIKGAQQDRPMVATPEPGTPERVRQSGGEAFAESWDQAGRAKDDLLGINGGDHAKEAWKGVAKGLWDVVNPDPVHQFDRAVDQATGAVDEIKSGIDNPKAFIGKHGIEIAAGIATAPLGGEGALLGTEARTGLHGIEDTTHHLPEPPSGATHPGPVVDHPAIPAVGDHTPTPAYQPPTPHEFDPGVGQHYASGDPHYPGGWPPGTPEATWSKGDTEPGWKYINHNVDKDWMPYQQQIGGLERTPTGALPEWAQPNPETGVPVDFDGHTHRGPQEVFLEAKDGYRGMAFAPDNTYWQGRADKAIDQVDRQLAAIPPGAKLEWHVSDPYGAAALRKLFIDNDIYGVDVIYTPKAP
ncbi:hypothetical protein A3N99_02935 [Mycobacteroides abscessus]|uniref:Tox-REase-5 domain-containing protein n=1 Tax=Mycobacteroides abscessus TaxID=36809 RepID=UPI00078C6C59|nr:Tox-REase-5 domain-containing protein [Mycobacteroides abscessus]AMU39260.1 hypothetical protein A3N99_02935 [Mycobacteroides abscessus]